MIRAIYHTPDGQLRIDVEPGAFSEALRDSQGLLWVDFVGESPDVCEPILRDIFGFHPLAIDDALREEHVPKIDDWGEYLYIVLHVAVLEMQDGVQVETHELDVFLGPNYLVTHHQQSINALDRVWELCQRDIRHLQSGADHLLYKLADELVADYMPVIDEMDEAIDRIEDEIFDRPTPNTLERIFALKRAALRLRRILTPQREVLNKLARDDYTVIDAKDRAYFRDVYDHVVRMVDINEALRDLVGGALDTYLSVINNRMNEAMKVLAVITTLFMPISFLAGFFGMNFFGPIASLSVWSGKLMLALALSVMLLSPIAMYLWIRRHGWM